MRIRSCGKRGNITDAKKMYKRRNSFENLSNYILKKKNNSNVYCTKKIISKKKKKDSLFAFKLKFSTSKKFLIRIYCVQKR